MAAGRQKDQIGRNLRRDNGREGGSSAAISAREVVEVEDRSAPRTPIIYEVVRRMGKEEMARPAFSLWWSGIAAGLSISFSVLGEAMLQMYLPDLPWRPLVSSFGYSIGFLMVVLARQQLFTENTITIVLPVIAEPTLANVWCLVRMWSIVFLANMAGTLFAALFCSLTPALSDNVLAAMLAVSHDVIEYSWMTAMFKGIAAGFLIAAMVWVMPAAATSQFHVVTLMTYLMALGGFLHIVAGSVEAFLLVINGEIGVWGMLSRFTFPVLVGNVIGGTALFALLSYAQVAMEI